MEEEGPKQNPLPLEPFWRATWPSRWRRAAARLIACIKAHETFDSRSNPTVEVDLSPMPTCSTLLCPAAYPLASTRRRSSVKQTNPPPRQGRAHECVGRQRADRAQPYWYGRHQARLQGHLSPPTLRGSQAGGADGQGDRSSTGNRTDGVSVAKRRWLRGSCCWRS